MVHRNKRMTTALWNRAAIGKRIKQEGQQVEERWDVTQKAKKLMKSHRNKDYYLY